MVFWNRRRLSYRDVLYPCAEATPRLFSYSEIEECATEFTRVNRYSMSYSCGRRWIRFTISITVCMESSHWDTFKTRQDRNDILSEYLYGLPRSLNALIKQDDHLSLYQETTSAKVKIQRSPAFSQVTKYLEQITTKLYLMGCQRYSENEVMRLPHRNPPSNFQFLAYIGGRWASCYQFGSRKAQIYAIIYWLQVSHCLRGTPGIRTPVGVVVDPESGIVNSVLTELPAGGKLFRLTTEPISWIRRLA
jgi:hypothetical protein